MTFVATQTTPQAISAVCRILKNINHKKREMFTECLNQQIIHTFAFSQKTHLQWIPLLNSWPDWKKQFFKINVLALVSFLCVCSICKKLLFIYYDQQIYHIPFLPILGHFFLHLRFFKSSKLVLSKIEMENIVTFG